MSLAWRIEWSKEALRDLSRLEHKDAKRLVKKIESIIEDPLAHFERLSRYDDYKIRAGDFRAICLLLFQTQTILVEKAGHHKYIYKNFSKK